MSEEVITYAFDRRTARSADSVLYLTDKFCPKGHKAPRYTSNGACTACLGLTLPTGDRGLPSQKTCATGHIYSGKRCPECLSVWKQSHPTDKSRHAFRQRSRVNNARLWLQNYKSTTPCKDCNNIFEWYVMEFDHIIPRLGDRTKLITRILSTGSIPALKKAIADCDLVCSNDHARRTHLQRQKGLI
jgi:hypothetical protein